MITLIALLFFAQVDAWEPYDDNAFIKGKKPHPVMPEPSTYGLIFVASAISFVAYKKFKRS